MLGGVVALVLLAAAAGAGLVARRFSGPSHPSVELGDLGTPSSVVMFTSTDCTTCGEARAVMRSLEVTIREVTYELEPAAFTAAGVEAVPMTVVVGADGTVAAQFTGVPPRRRAHRAIRAAGIATV